MRAQLSNRMLLANWTHRAASLEITIVLTWTCLDDESLALLAKLEKLIVLMKAPERPDQFSSGKELKHESPCLCGPLRSFRNCV
jgi:hypothetical protein